MLALLSSLTTDLKKQIKGSENEQRLDDINSLGGQLLSVLDDFRDFASHTIEAKAAEEDHQITPNEEADLSEILDDLASEVWDNQVAALKAAKGPDVRIPPPPELILTLDPSLRSKQSLVSVDSFRKVARKLIDNALKFTPGVGFVEISLAPHRMQDVQDHTSKEPTKNYIRLTVEDTGKGMTNEFVSDKLFAPFAKADSFKSGAGLSMALCSSLVRRMGGSMQVSSDKDRGTTIIVLIP
jgi:signal transduction histidine kinase